VDGLLLAAVQAADTHAVHAVADGNAQLLELFRHADRSVFAYHEQGTAHGRERPLHER
jgi:hypothetical protein